VKPSKFATKRQEHVPGRTDELEKKTVVAKQSQPISQIPQILAFLGAQAGGGASGAGFFVSHTHIHTEGAPCAGL
jgi:hypothetical protein